MIGTIYVLGAIGTLSWYVISSWGAAGLLDRLLQLALIGSAAAGAAFLLIAADNLKITFPRRRTPHDSPTRRRAAAA